MALNNYSFILLPPEQLPQHLDRIEEWHKQFNPAPGTDGYAVLWMVAQMRALLKDLPSKK